MAAQSAGWWLGARGTPAAPLARHAAIGGALFLASDALLAINKFALPLPLAQVWVLATYYAAQLLIATGARPAVAVPAAASTAPRSMPADPIPGRG
jgi:uncharacterized membrane protein YhhN